MMECAPVSMADCHSTPSFLFRASADPLSPATIPTPPQRYRPPRVEGVLNRIGALGAQDAATPDRQHLDRRPDIAAQSAGHAVFRGWRPPRCLRRLRLGRWLCHSFVVREDFVAPLPTPLHDDPQGT